MSQPEGATRFSDLLRNWVSIAGVLVATIAFLAGTVLLIVEMREDRSHPYFGLIVYGLVPAMIAGGLFLILAGMIWTFLRRGKRGGAIPLPTIDLANSVTLKRVFLAVCISVIFVLVSSVATYRTYHFTESTAFCGTVCHTVMKPEYTSFQNSPHSRTTCTTCHIGPGAEWYVRAKMSGLYQVYSTALNKYHRPIETPVANLRPAKETCLTCHWPQKFFGAVLKTSTTYLPDAKNSPWTIKMLLNIGGGDPAHSLIHGIHWHMEGVNTVEYIASDRKRSVIPWVRVTDQKGKTTVYQTTEKSERITPEQMASLPRRQMDCIDCHNRPSHRYLSPYQALDIAMFEGTIDRTIPSIKQTAAKLMVGNYDTDAQARDAIAAGLREKYPQHPKLNETIKEVQAIYSRNFFPEMKVRWSEYPSLTGHKITAGCFRCHDGKHVSESGATIRKDCNMCHTFLAQGPGTESDLQGLSANGVDFKHPEDIDDAWKTDRCDTCHTGAP
jgi:hypothetical protein